MAAIYPADTFQEGVDLTIEASNQLAQVVRGDANTEVMVADGSTIPSIRKAQADSMYFKEPELWVKGQTETDYLQLKKYIDPTNKESWWFAKSATVLNPVVMGTSPFGDDNWTLYTPEDLFISGKAEYESIYQALKGKAAEAGYNLVRGSFEEGGTLTKTGDVLWYQANGRYYSWKGSLPNVVPAGSTPATSGGIGAGAWVDRTDATLRAEIGVITKKFSSVFEMIADTTLAIGDTVEWVGYYNVFDGGGGKGEVVNGATGVHDGGSFFDLTNGLQVKAIFTGGYFHVQQFGYVGDGGAYENQAIQNCYNACPDGGKVIFSKKGVAKLSTKLIFNKSVSVDFNGTTLLLNNSSSPTNHHFDIFSTTESTQTWTESISKGQNTLNLSSSLLPGDYALVQLGTDPYDTHEEHWVKVCRVVANSGSVITIDQMLPYSINGTSHKIAKIKSLVSNCSFENVNIDYVNGTVPDTSIFPHSCFNVEFRNIHSVKSRILINPYDCHNITFDNISGYVIKSGVSSHGRLISCWQVEDATFDNIDGYNSDGDAMIFFESFSRNIKLRNIKLNNSNPSAITQQVFVTGGSYGIDIDGYSYNSISSQPVAGVGGGVGEYSLSNLRLSSYPKLLDLPKVRNFKDTDKNIDFINQSSLFDRIEVSMQPNLSDSKRRFCAGVVKNMWVYVADKTHLTALYVMNSNNQGSNIVSSLISGGWVKIQSTIVGYYGRDYPFNNPDYPQKYISMYTDSEMTANTKLTVAFEYWPIVDGSQYTFPTETDV